MTLRPTNVYRRLGEEFAYSVHTQLDSAALRRALEAAACRGRDDEEVEDNNEAVGDGSRCQTETVWTAVLPLGPEFEPGDVSVKLDESGAFWVTAEAASPWQPGDYARLTRRIQLPAAELVDIGSVKCWIEEDLLVLQADRLKLELATGKKPDRKKSSSVQGGVTWPRCSLSEGQQRHGNLVKDGKGHRAAIKWTLDLALPEFSTDEVTVNRSSQEPGRLVVTARHTANATDGVHDSSVEHQYRREILPPVGVQLDLLVTRFGRDGVLRLEAPAPGLKCRRGALGIVGGAAGGAGAKIASLTRELRGVGIASASASASASSASPVAADREVTASPSAARAKNCAIQ